MTIQVNVHDAKTNLSRLLAMVEEGQEVVIARNGRPVARIIPEPRFGVPHLGLDEGLFEIPEDFDELPEGFLVALESDDLEL
jgi:prevent-host-death family protein